MKNGSGTLVLEVSLASGLLLTSQLSVDLASKKPEIFGALVS